MASSDRPLRGQAHVLFDARRRFVERTVRKSAVVARRRRYVLSAAGRAPLRFALSDGLG
jgi:hypothetical protein